MKFFEFIKSGFTDSLGNLDDARVSAFLLVLAFIYNASMATHKTGIFDAQNFGIGAGALAAGIGIWFKQRGSN